MQMLHSHIFAIYNLLWNNNNNNKTKKNNKYVEAMQAVIPPTSIPSSLESFVTTSE